MTGSDEKQAFISHAKEDRATAQVLCERLEARGVRCWIAPRDIPPASDWAGSIVGAVRECKVLVLVLSVNSNESEHVRREVSQAVEAGDPVFLLRVDGVPLSDSLGYFLSSKQFVEVDASAGDRELHMERLVQAVASHIETGRAQVPAAPAPARSRRVLYAGLGAAAVAVALGVAFWQWNGEDPSPSGGSESNGDAPVVEPWTPFTRVQSLPIGAGAFEMVAGRFRGSDALDLAIVARDADSGSGSVEVHGLDGETTNVALEDPTGLVRGDVDRDGRDDLIVPCADGSAEFWQLDEGAWTRRSRQPRLAHATLSNLTATDLDADGRVDLLSVGDDRVALGASYGDDDRDPWVFRPGSRGLEPFQSGIGLALTADLDGDRLPDTVIVEPEQGRGTVFWGTPRMLDEFPCDLDLFANSLPFAAPTGASAVCAGDVDSDGRLDLAIAKGSSGGVEILMQRAERTFELAASIATPAATTLALADFDGDGALDAALGGDSGLALVRGPLSADSVPSAVDLELAEAPIERLVAADLDRDGALELAALQAGARVVSVLSGPDPLPAWTGTFGGPEELVLQPGVDWSHVGDVDGDGFAELIGWHSEVGEKHFLAVARLDRQESPKLFNVTFNPDPGGLIWDVDVGDQDGDGRCDVAAIFREDRDLLVIHHGTEDGKLEVGNTVDLGMSMTHLQQCLVLADFLMDGHLDVLVPVRGLVPGAPDGGFGLRERELDLASGVEARDLDGDGVLDVYWDPVEARTPPTAMWAPGLASGCPPRGTGGFGPPRPLPDGWPVDVDGDGRTELLGFANDTFSLRRGRYDGDEGFVFDVVETLPCPVPSLRQIALADFLGTSADQFLGLGEDGLVLISLAGPEPVVRVGPVAVDLAGTCLAEEGLAGASGILVNDVDSDGRMDLLAFDGAENKVVLLLAAPDLAE